MASEAPASTAVQSGAAVGRVPRDSKVFVGNLPHGIADKQLQAFFAEAAAKPKVKITRPGCALLTFKTAADAAHAIATFDKKTLDGCEIKVTKALPIAARLGQNAKSPTNADHDQATNGELRQDNAEGTANQTQPKKTKRRTRKKRTPATAAEGDASLAAGGETNETSAEQPVTPGDLASDAPAEANGTTDKPKKPRKHKKPKGPGVENKKKEIEGVDNPLKIHVGNIPKSWTTDTLQNAFQAHKPVSVDLVKGPDGKSKGFGFVEFSSQEVRDEALKLVIPLPDYKSDPDTVLLDQGPHVAKTLKITVAKDRPKRTTQQGEAQKENVEVAKEEAAAQTTTTA